MIGDEDDYLGVKQYLNILGENELSIFPGISYGFIRFNDICSVDKLIWDCNKDL